MRNCGVYRSIYSSQHERRTKGGFIMPERNVKPLAKRRARLSEPKARVCAPHVFPRQAHERL